MVKSGYAMKEIKEDVTLCRFDGVAMTKVYAGSFDNLINVKLQWRKEHVKEIDEDIEVLKLSEIVEQIGKPYMMITVFINDMFSGKILQYGNYGDSWWEIGCTCGYA